jgi:homocysteine S-methyltransferase
MADSPTNDLEQRNRMKSTQTRNPLEPILERQGFVVLDGGLATTLESFGHDLDDPLWSARLLLESAESIGRAHRAFLDAGADCIATVSYQASFEGFARRGLSEDEAERLVRLSVELALAARNEFWALEGRSRERLRPLVAASVGPYGAFLADGSEYRGRYDIDQDLLDAFHRRRWRLLAETDADLLACETVPSRSEAEVFLRLLRETPGRWAWLSFSCSDHEHLSDGSRLADVARLCDAEERVSAVGINCTAPKFIDSLIAEARSATSKPIAVYPNRGEAWDAGRKRWIPSDSPLDFAEKARHWRRLGASLIGGCCRVGPEEIARIRAALGSSCQ